MSLSESRNKGTRGKSSRAISTSRFVLRTQKLRNTVHNDKAYYYYRIFFSYSDHEGWMETSLCFVASGGGPLPTRVRAHDPAEKDRTWTPSTVRSPRRSGTGPSTASARVRDSRRRPPRLGAQHNIFTFIYVHSCFFRLPGVLSRPSAPREGRILSTTGGQTPRHRFSTPYLSRSLSRPLSLSRSLSCVTERSERSSP